MIITWCDWQQRLELVEPEPRPDLTPEQKAALERVYARLAADLERALLEAMTGPTPAPVTHELERRIERPGGLFYLATS